MYVDSFAVINHDKFKNFILDYQNTIDIQLKNLEEKMKRDVKLLELRETRDVQALLNAKSFFLSINPNLEGKFKTIEFYVLNDAKNAEQVITAFDYILDTCKVYIENNQNDSILRSQYQEAIEKCDKILKGDFSDLDFFQKILSVSNLTEEEKLSVLSKIAYDSCKFNMIKENDDVVVIEGFDEDIYSRILEIVSSKYENLKQRVNDIITRNYNEFIQNKSEEELSYARTIVDCIDKKEMTIEDVSNFNYVREKMMVLLFSLMKEKEEIDSILIEFSKSVKEDDIELLEETLKDFEKMIDSVIQAEEEYKLENQTIEENKNPSNIYFLMDESGKTLFNLDDFHNDDKKKLAVLLEKTQKGILDYDKGLKHTIIQSPHKMNNLIEVNKYSNFACAYIRIAKNKILVLQMGEVKDIYDEGIYIDSYYQGRISIVEELIKNNNSEEMQKQERVWTYLNEKLELGKVR